MAKTLGVPSPADLVAGAQAESGALAALLAATGPGQSVHGARRRIKQLRSLLRLLRSALGETACQEVNAALRSTADALAGHRRAEALVVTAARHVPAEGLDAGFWCGLAKGHQVLHARDGDPLEALARASEGARHAAQLLAAAPLAELSHSAVFEAFLADYRKARRRLHQGLRSGAPATLHEARKFVIHHLHHLKLLEPRARRRLTRLEALREVLGDLNDLDELEQLASGLAIGDRDARAMKKARKRLLQRAGRAAETLFRRSPAAFGKRMRHAAMPGSP